MDCHNILELLSAYGDGEVTAGEKQLVEDHVAECEDCARRLGELEQLDLLLARLPEAKASAGFDESVSRRVRKPGNVITFFTPRRVGVAAAAVAVLVVGVAVGVSFLGSTELTETAYLPNLDLLADEEYLGIDRYDFDPAGGSVVLPAFDMDSEEEEQ
jgi:anti-sigma factor RsiW